VLLFGCSPSPLHPHRVFLPISPRRWSRRRAVARLPGAGTGSRHSSPACRTERGDGERPLASQAVDRPSLRGTRRSRSGRVACGGSLRPALAARRGLARAPALGRCPCERVCASRTPNGSGVRLVLASTLVCARRVCACGRVDVRWREVARGRAGGRFVKKRPKQLVGGRARLLVRGPCDALHRPMPQLNLVSEHQWLRGRASQRRSSRPHRSRRRRGPPRHRWVHGVQSAVKPTRSRTNRHTPELTTGRHSPRSPMTA